MIEYAVEGHDGSGKTPIVQGVRKKLIDAGFKVEVCAPFQEANCLIDEPDIYVYWKDDASSKKAVELLLGVVRKFQEKSCAENVDVLLYDRHWMTVLGEIDHRSSLEGVWPFFVPTFFIEAPPSKTMDCKRFSFEVPWTNSKETIQGYYERYLRLADKYSNHIVARFKVEKRDQPLDEIIGAISNYVVSKLV